LQQPHIDILNQNAEISINVNKTSRVKWSFPARSGRLSRLTQFSHGAEDLNHVLNKRDQDQDW